MTKTLSNLFPGILLALLSVSLLFLVSSSKTPSGVQELLIIIAGMTTLAAVTAFQRFVENQNHNSMIQLSFNEFFVSRSISEGLPEPKKMDVELENIQESPIYPWDLTPGQLVAIDNSLALAKLRMDIEKELRRIAYENKIDIRTRPLGVIGLANELITAQILPTSSLEALKEIISACNQAIHGADVSDETAASVVRVGSQLLERLRLASMKSN